GVSSSFAAAGEDVITDLNSILVADGAVLTVTRGTVVGEPIRIVFVNTGSTPAAAAHARLVVRLAEGAQATIIETHEGIEEAAYLATQVFDVAVGDGARLVHLRHQAEGREAVHLLSGEVRVGRDATYDGFTLSLGAALARTETRLRFTGRGGDGRVAGAYHADGRRHVDTTTLIDHAVPDCRSREVFHGVLDGRGRGVFQGKIIVQRSAQRTDGHQLNR